MSALLLALTLQAYPPAATLEEVRAKIDAAPRAHPRLLTTAAGLKALGAGDGLRRAVAGELLKSAGRLLDEPPVARKLEGRRLLGVSRTCVQRVSTLAAAYHLSGDERYARRAGQEMLAAARFEDWNPSHFLDTAEMTFALALGYDWLYDRLGEEARAEIRAAIVRKGLELPFKTAHKGWVKARNNWGQVCHGGLSAGALAVLEDEPELASKTVHNALQNVVHSMDAYSPKGSYPEGPGYWSYGTGYNVLLIAALESALGTDFGLSKAPGFSETGAYPDLVGGPSGWFFNYADGSATRRAEPFRFWFADRFGRPDWLREDLRLLRADPAAPLRDRFYALTLLWLREPAAEEAPRLPLHWKGDGEVPVSVHRSSWDRADGVFVGLKGGSPSANHGHMDIGSFVLDADGVRWALDLGAEGYHGIESRGMNLWDRRQESDRWKIFRQRNEGHNTLVVDGGLQKASASGRFVRFSDDAAFPHSVLDLGAVYEGRLKSAFRGVALLPSREVLIQDRLTGLAPGSRVRWGMITPGTPAEPGGASIRLAQGGARLELAILSPPGACWTIVDTAAPRQAWDSPNPGTRMLAFEVAAPESGELSLAVLATPGSCGTSSRTRLALKPSPEEWGR